MNSPCNNCCDCTTDAVPEKHFEDQHDTASELASVYAIPKMDCPAEERMIRLALNGVDGIHRLIFDLPGRQLRVVHDGSEQAITEKLLPLGLGATYKGTVTVNPSGCKAGSADAEETSTLRTLLAINAVMFVVELVAGWIAQSTGLIGDSLDMLADAAVYGLALYTVGRSVSLQVRAAHLSGILQLLLALGLLAEVVRKFLMGSEPESIWMMLISFIALLANVTCLVLISKHRNGGAHMKASWIFSANDVLINGGVILAGAMVYWTESNYPDLVIGTCIGLIVLNGARRILALEG